MAVFSGSLNSNEFYNSLYNAYRLVMTYADNLNGLDDTLANRYRADGGMYHDQSVYTDMDIPFSVAWDPDDTNVLKPEFKVKPIQQKITTNRMRQIGLYTDEYLSKRAWMDPASYDQFRAVVQKQITEAKRVYEQRIVDTYAGCLGTQKIELTLPTDADAEAQNRLQAMAIAKEVGDLMIDLKDTSRDFNTSGFMKAFKESDFDIIWNADYYNKIRYTDLPTIFHTEDLLKNGHILPNHYFGELSSGTAAGAGDRIAAEEYFIPVDASGKYSATGTNAVHVFPGDILPEGTPITSTVSSTAETYTMKTLTVKFNKLDSRSVSVPIPDKCRAFALNTKIICKVVHKDAIKYLSSFETQTEFWNPKNLTTNRYLTWAFANPELLSGYPCVTIVDA